MTPLLQSLHFFSRYGVTLSFIFIISGMAAEVVSFNLAGELNLEPQWADSVASLIGSALFEPFASGVAIYFIASRDQGELLSVYDCVTKAWGVYARMVVCYLLTSMLVVFGLSLYLIPGVYIFYKLILTEYFVVLNNNSPQEAILNSFNQTRGKAVVLIPSFSVILLTMLAGTLLIDHMVVDSGGGAGIRVFGAILEAPVTAYVMIVGYRLYSLTGGSVSKTGI